MTLFEKLSIELKNQKGNLEISKEGKWLNLNRGLINLSIEFDERGNHINRIVVCQDVMQVVDQKLLF